MFMQDKPKVIIFVSVDIISLREILKDFTGEDSAFNVVGLITTVSDTEIIKLFDESNIPNIGLLSYHDLFETTKKEREGIYKDFINSLNPDICIYSSWRYEIPINSINKIPLNICINMNNPNIAIYENGRVSEEYIEHFSLAKNIIRKIKNVFSGN
jgi:hypothetical protein